MNDSPKLRVLLVLQEFTNWPQARPWTYTGSFGIVEGLDALDVETFILPAYGHSPPDLASLWLRRGQEMCRGKEFDQVWIWLVHVPYDQSFLDWLSELAPVRVGWVCESLVYEPDEWRQDPQLQGRREYVVGQMRGLTHVVAVDENDVEYINSQGLARSIWWPQCVPERFVNQEYTEPSNNAAAFYGIPYSEERRRIIQHPDVQGLLVCPQSPENNTTYPGQFDELHRQVISGLQNGSITADEQNLIRYIDTLRNIRVGVFSLWMESLKQWSAIANLPTYLKAYAGRVIEAMAAGRPVISWEVPDRPRARALFEEGREILLYERSDPGRLAEHIRAIQRDHEFGLWIAENARQKVLRYHTSEIRVRQILTWLQTGDEPDYG